MRSGGQRARPRGALRAKLMAGSIALIAVLPWAGPAFSQASQDLKRQTERTRTTIKSDVDADEAARRAATSQITRGRTVTYQDVLKDPDNIDLNFEYAKTQVRQGDILGASATLERILLVQPNLPRVRVLYALVLYRLDNLQEAERELKSVLKFKMPPSLRAQLRRLLKRLQWQNKRTRFSVLMNHAYEYDSNRNAAPGSGFLQSAFGPQLLTGDDTKQPDSSYQGLARFEVEHDLGFQARHRLFGSAAYYHGEQNDVNRFSLGSVEVIAGGVYDAAPTEIRTAAYWRYVRLGHSSILNAYGGRILVDHRISKKLVLFAFGQGEAQEFRNTPDFPTARQERGPEYRAGVGGRFVLSPTMRVRGNVSFIRKTANVGFFEYSGVQVSGQHLWLLGKGMFLLSYASYEYDGYDDPDPSISPRTRDDQLVRVRLTFGVPLENLLFGHQLPDAVHNTTVVVSGEFFRSLSNVTNFTYTNYRFIAGISTRFDF